MVKILSILFSFILIVFCLRCNRVNDSLKGRCIYTGKIVLLDSLNGNKTRVETDSIVSVKLYLGTGLTNYLYEKKSEGKGIVNLDFLQADEEHRLTATLKVNGVQFSGDTIFKPQNCDRKYYLNISNDTLVLTLYASVANRNSTTFNIIDADQKAVPKAEGCLFSSEVLFNTKNCLNSNYSAMSNETGKLIFNNVAAGDYYLYVVKRLDTTANAPFISGSTFLTIPTVSPKTVQVQ